MADRIVMMGNGFVDSWLLLGEGAASPFQFTGCSEAETERIGRERATRVGVPFFKQREPWLLPEEPSPRDADWSLEEDERKF